jgi:membrane fusion protein, multidrug efflux system
MTRKNTWISSATLAVALMAAAACKGTTAGDAKGASAELGRPAVAVTVAPVVTADLVEAVDVVGSLAPKYAADVKSELSGIISGVYVTEWVPVRKGQPLARLDTSETEAGIDALKAVEAQARVAEVRAKREQERAVQLKQYGLITPQNFDDAQSALDAAHAAVDAAQAQVRAAETRLKKAFINAPLDGVVASRAVNVGDRV